MLRSGNLTRNDIVRHLNAMLCLASVLFTALAQADETCTLQRLADLPVTFMANDAPVIHAQANGHDITLRIATNDPLSTINARAAGAMGIKPKQWTNENIAFSLGAEDIKSTVRVSELQVGEASIVKPEFLYIENPKIQFADYDGVLAIDILRNFDVELDFANARMRLFSPNHCKDKVAYWSGDYGQVTLLDTPLHIPYFWSTLDGHNLLTVIQTNTKRTSLDPDVARSQFPASKSGFGEWDLDAIALSHPAIETNCKLSFCKSNYDKPVDLALGMNHLKKLRLYLAFGDKKLYILPPTLSAAAK